MSAPAAAASRHSRSMDEPECPVFRDYPAGSRLSAFAMVSPRTGIRIIIAGLLELTSVVPFKEDHRPGLQGRQSIYQRPGSANLPQAANSECVKMAIQIVMDRTGDTRHSFDIHDRVEVEKAERRFKELTGAGFTAAVRTGPGEQKVIRSFDPTAEETLFYPRLVGG
jgi:hypothetical protein